MICFLAGILIGSATTIVIYICARVLIDDADRKRKTGGE